MEKIKNQQNKTLKSPGDIVPFKARRGREIRVSPEYWGIVFPQFLADLNRKNKKAH